MSVTTLDFLPPPFTWINIPTGNVTLEAGGYIPEGGQTFEVAAFAIAEKKTTNAQFAKFIEAGGYHQQKWWSTDGWEARQHFGWTEPRFWQDNHWNKSGESVVGVSWYEGVAFCLWLTDITSEEIMLPTEQQWQRAVLGDTYWEDIPIDPSGECRKDTRVIGLLEQSKNSTPIGKNSALLGPVDIWNACADWTLTDYDTGHRNIELPATIRVRRKAAMNMGSFVYDSRSAFEHLSHQPRDRTHDGGFRLVRL